MNERRAADATEVTGSPPNLPADPSPAANGDDARPLLSAKEVRECEDVATRLMWSFAKQYMPATVAALEAGPQFPSPGRRVIYRSEAGRIVTTGDLTIDDPHLVFWLGVQVQDGALQGLGWVRVDPTSGAVDMACAGRIAGCDAYPGEDPWYRPPFEHRLQLEVRTACGGLAKRAAPD